MSLKKTSQCELLYFMINQHYRNRRISQLKRIAPYEFKLAQVGFTARGVE